MTAHWELDARLEQVRTALASSNSLVRALQKQTLNAASSESQQLKAHLADYEQRLASHVARGGELPAGVAAPSGNTTDARADFAHEVATLLSQPRPEPEQQDWVPDPRVEQLRRYAQSGDARERAIAGESAELIRSYESGLRRHLDAGGPMPRGVLEIPRDVNAGGYSWSADWTRPVA